MANCEIVESITIMQCLIDNFTSFFGCPTGGTFKGYKVLKMVLKTHLEPVYCHLVYTHLVYYPFGLPQYAKNSHFPCPKLNPIPKLKP